MSRGFVGFVVGWVGVLLCACATVLEPSPALPPLWRPAIAPGDAETLRIEPRNSSAVLGSEAMLRVSGTGAADARCQLADGEPLVQERDSLRVPSPSVASPATVLCHAGELRAEAQVTFTDAQTLPVADPYQGGVVLFKLRQLGEAFREPVARDSLGFATLDAKLEALGALVLPAFPFDRTGARDAVGLGLWVAIDLPEGVNFYQAVSWLRADPNVHAESYLTADGAFLRVQAGADWPTPLREVTRVVDPDADGYRTAMLTSAVKRAAANSASPELVAIGAPQVWGQEQGDGVRLAVIDTGVDANHAALAPNLHDKSSEREGDDLDGNGVPGDRYGVNLAQLAIAHDEQGARLALGAATDVSDWDGATERTRQNWGHGTAIASLAAGAGGAGLPLGVAPRAQILVVDVQENLRTSLAAPRDADPRASEGDAAPASLRTSTWARAAGIAYAVGERARVMTCAWPGEKPHWILHDALLFAEDNCATLICGPGDEAGATGSYPSHWRKDWLEKNGGDTGVVWDPWSNEESSDVLLRPLRGLVVANATPSREVAPDLVLPPRSGGAMRVPAALSNPRNDGSSVPDRRVAEQSGDVTAVGLTAGAALLVTGERPDLEPWAVREALVNGASRSTGEPALSVAGAIAATGPLETGACRALMRREAPREVSPWPSLKVKTSMDDPLPGAPPASPAPEDAKRRR
jgi:hypothetical protein